MRRHPSHQRSARLFHLEPVEVADHLVQADPTAPPDDTEMPEAYTTLGFLAARTERVGLCSGLMQIPARRATATAMATSMMCRRSR